jgi:hypothetical protein
VIEKFKCKCHDESISFLLTNVKKKYEKGNIQSIFINRKKSLDFQKIESHVKKFPYWFGSITSF